MDLDPKETVPTSRTKYRRAASSIHHPDFSSERHYIIRAWIHATTTHRVSRERVTCVIFKAVRTARCSKYYSPPTGVLWSAGVTTVGGTWDEQEKIVTKEPPTPARNFLRQSDVSESVSCHPLFLRIALSQPSTLYRARERWSTANKAKPWPEPLQ